MSDTNQFVLVLQDGEQPGMIDVAGVQKPEAYDASSPAHLVGNYIKDHISELVYLAGEEAARSLAVAALAGKDSEAVKP